MNYQEFWKRRGVEKGGYLSSPFQQHCHREENKKILTPKGNDLSALYKDIQTV